MDQRPICLWEPFSCKASPGKTFRTVVFDALRARGTVVSWANRTDGVPSCPAPRRPAAPPCAAPPRPACGMSELWIRKVQNATQQVKKQVVTKSRRRSASTSALRTRSRHATLTQGRHRGGLRHEGIKSAVDNYVNRTSWKLKLATSPYAPDFSTTALDQLLKDSS